MKQMELVGIKTKVNGIGSFHVVDPITGSMKEVAKICFEDGSVFEQKSFAEQERGVSDGVDF